MNWINMLLILHNNAVYCLAVLIVLSLMIKRRFISYLCAFFLITSIGIFLTLIGQSYLNMPLVVCVLTLFFAIGNGSLRQTFSQSLTAVFIIWCLITPFSCLVMIIAPVWHDTPGCNLLTGLVLMLYTVCIRWVSSKTKQFRTLWYNKHFLFLELIVMMFFTLILPQYFPVFLVENKRRIGVFTLSFFLFLVFFVAILHQMQRTERQRRELQESIRQQEHLIHQTQSQFDTVVALRHYYLQLYQSMAPLIRGGDMNSLQTYFEQYILPIYQDYLGQHSHLLDIQNVAIRHLLEMAISQIHSMEGIALELTVTGTIYFPDHLEMDVFEMICNLFDNAVRELQGQTSGLLRIALQCDEAAILVTIANTVQQLADIETLYNPEERKSNGHGLKRIREIVYQRPELEHFTYSGGRYGEKGMLVQQIMVECRG